MRSTSLWSIIGFLNILSGLVISLQSATADTSFLFMTTDKTGYIQGEMIEIVVTNRLDIPIWYIGYHQRELVFWIIERAQNNDWHRLNFCLPINEKGKEFCHIAMYERPLGVVTELKPHSDLTHRWNQRICLFKNVTEPTEPEVVQRGRYRFLLHYSLGKVKLKSMETEPWKRPVELNEIRVVYSNEFAVE